MDDVELALKAELDRQARRLLPKPDSWQAFQQKALPRTRGHRRQWAAPALAAGLVTVVAAALGITLWSATPAPHRKPVAVGASNVPACSTHPLGSEDLLHPGIGHGRLLLSLVRLDDGGVGACLTYGQDSSMTELTTHPGILGANVVAFLAETDIAGKALRSWTVVGAVSAEAAQLKALGTDGGTLTVSLAHAMTTIDGYRVFAAPLPPGTDPATVRLQAAASDGTVLDTVDVAAVTIPKS